MIGLDTGFFFRLLAGTSHAVEAWAPIVSGERSAAVSCITLYELEKAALRGALRRNQVDVLLDEIPILCHLAWLADASHVHRAARLAHGNGLGMADALILTSLRDANAETVYTTDSDFERYDGPMTIVVLPPPTRSASR